LIAQKLEFVFAKLPFKNALSEVKGPYSLSLFSFILKSNDIR